MIVTLTLALAAALMADPPVRPGPAATPAAVAQAKPVRYCIEGARTGSRIVRRDCRTRAEWLERGFDPLAPQE